ncbi:hypothetical protein F503_06983 [Ophiostoma piceae UAMH 11346]|uniref:Borealin N-terminal domain-containing protein n=1 Tax=Ophiostoma piceae (strain UAMH 11346) TaxID=1262450 RepID=S3C8Q6_OPHP1|nr:hypothetical protein F503_06983 [Ophiostoma piceae UAMH 11346]
MPPRGRKRKSESIASEMDDAPSMTTTTTAGQKVATKTSSAEESPRKRQKTGVTAAQKQALIDNLQLEVTERARKLRAQYSLQAQGLRTRIEIRVNRIPMALRKLKMGELLQKHSTSQQKPAASKKTPAYSSEIRPAAPPVPEKDYHAARPPMSRAESSPRAAVSRPMKRLSDQLAGGDKENQNTHLDNPKKRQRAGNASAATHTTQSAQVLSPASSNSRLNPRERGAAAHAHAPSSPVKSFIARPMSPTKQSTNLISSMVEKARATRAATTRKPTTSSTASSAAGGTSRARAKATTATAAAPASRSTAAAVARNARRISGISESSDASTSTVVRKVGRPPGSTAASGGARKVTGTTSSSAAKKSVMGSIKKSMASASTKKAPAAKAAPATAAAATTRSGRILRKRE